MKMVFQSYFTCKRFFQVSFLLSCTGTCINHGLMSFMNFLELIGQK